MTIKFKNIVMKPMQEMPSGSVQGWIKLNNGLEVSIVKHQHSYGGGKGFYEMGVFQDGEMLHIHKWHDQVKGWLTPEDVEKELHYLEWTALHDNNAQKLA
jgi:hypothetical protein